MLTLDDKTALLPVDLQKGILTMLPDEVRRGLVDGNAALAQAFKDAGLPVVWIHATGLPTGRVERPIPEDDELPADFADLDDALPVTEGDKHVYKQRTWSAFPRTDLEEHLTAEGITQVVLAGIATGGGVESTARSAYDAGFNVVVVSDACVDGNETRHHVSLTEDLPSIGEVTTSEELRAALQSR